MLIGRRSPGLGATYKIGSGGQVIDCDLWSNITESVCWIPGGELSQQAVTDASGTTVYQPVLPATVAATSWGLYAAVGAALLLGLLLLREVV
jgi:hypothetical protein